MIGTRPRVTRLVIAALLVLPALVASVSPSLAAPSKQDVEAAKQKLLAAQDQFAAMNEQYNQAVYELQQAQQHLDEALAMKKAAEQQAATRAGRSVQACRPGLHRHGLPVRVAPVGRVDVGVLRPPRVPGGDHPDGRRPREPGRRRGAAGRVGLAGVRPGGRRPPAEGRINSSSRSRPQRTPSRRPSRSRPRPKSDYNSWVQQQQQAIQQAASKPAPTSIQLAVAPPELRWRWYGNFNPPPASGAGATAAAAASPSSEHPTCSGPRGRVPSIARA